MDKRRGGDHGVIKQDGRMDEGDWIVGGEKRGWTERMIL